MNFNLDNQQKTLAGKASNLSLKAMLDSISIIPKINISISKNYSIGYEGCVPQFKMDYQITFHDFNDESWLVKSTSSIRSDRIYGNEFFAQNIKLIDDFVSKIFIVVPDSISETELQNKITYSEKIHSKSYISFIDDVLTISELRQQIISHATEKIEQGMSSNILGNDAEEIIVQLLTDKNNLLLWNDYDKYNKTVKSASFRWFVEILKKSGFSINNYKIEQILATNKIPKLKNKGYPKTDVVFTIIGNGIEENRTISIKNTTARIVTVHEGDVEDLIISLELQKENPLADSLRKFQKFGSAKGLLENDPFAYKVLNEKLPEFNKKLVEFFVFGVNSPLVNNAIQIVDLLLYTNKFEVISREAYTSNYINEFKNKGQFGTPFQWTYPSKKRGQKIQIKGFTNNKK